MKNNTKYSSKDLREFCTNVLLKFELPFEDAALVADSLVQANLRGVDSHGVTRMGIYTDRLKKGLIDPKPQVETIKETAATALLNGKHGMGQVVASKAMKIAITKAKEAGIGFVGVMNSSHFGTAAYFSQMALEEDMIGIALSNAPATMALWGGKTPFVGTNPFSFAVPTGLDQPIILDMATSIIARGKIIMAAQKGEVITHGIAVDKEGIITTNAADALEGAVLPFGGAKGSGIALLIDILAGVLNGAAFGPHISDLYRNFEEKQNVGHLLGAINLDAFTGLFNFKAGIAAMVKEIKGLPAAKGVECILLPGEIELEKEKMRELEGIELDFEVVSELKVLAKTYEVKWIGCC